MHQIKKNKEYIFFKKLLTCINQKSLNTDGLIMCGDFNCQLDSLNNDKSIRVL